MKNKYGLIVNLCAGSHTEDRLNLILEKFKQIGADFVLFEGERPKILVQKAIDANCNIIVAGGGDGTVNEIASVLVDHEELILGIYPLGSGNDIARSYGISLNPIKAIDTILYGEKKKVDIGYANEYFFMNIASIGFDAHVVEKQRDMPKWIPSSWGYRISVLLLAFSFKEDFMTLEIKNKKIQKEILLSAIAIGNYYGGGIEIAPRAIVDDGILDITYIDKVNILQRMILLPALARGGYLEKIKSVHFDRTKEITIKTKKPTILNIDGELIFDISEVNFTIEQEKLNILI